MKGKKGKRIFSLNVKAPKIRKKITKPSKQHKVEKGKGSYKRDHKLSEE